MLLGRGAAVRVLLETCAPSPCAPKVRQKPEAFHLRGLGPPRTERVRGVASVGRAGPGEVLYSGGPESVQRQSVFTKRKNGFFGDRISANSRIMVPQRAERVRGVVHIGSKIRAGKGTVNYFGSGGLEYMYASQSSPNEIMFCLGGELQQAVVYWCSLLIARSCMHDIYDLSLIHI